MEKTNRACPKQHAVFVQVLCGLLLLVALAAYVLESVYLGRGPLSQASTGWLTIALYLSGTVLMLAVWRYNAPKSTKSPNATLRDHRLILYTAVVMRLVLIPIDPVTSNDVSRYMFDGRIVVEGYDPYRISHDAPELETLRDAWSPPGEHAKYPTLYPPVSLALFALTSLAGPAYAPLLWKLLSTLAGIMTVWVGALVLKRGGRLRHLPLLAFSPLLLFETGIGAHIDAFSALVVVCVMFAWQQRQMIRVGLMIGLGVTIKILPFMFLLPFFFFLKNIKQQALLVGSALGFITIIYGLVILLGYIPIGSTPTFFEKWRSASPLFTVLNYFYSGRTFGILLLLITFVSGAAIAWFSWRYSAVNLTSAKKVTMAMWEKKNPVVFFLAQCALALPLLISPVVFPWYLMPLVPLVAYSPNWIFLSWFCLAPLTYEVLGQFVCCGEWNEANWPVWVISVGLFLAIVNQIRSAWLVRFRRL